MLAVMRVLVGTLFLLRTTPVAILLLPYAQFPFLGWPEHGWKMSAFGPTLPAWLCIALCFGRTVTAIAFTIGFHARASGIATAVMGYALLANDAMAYTNTLHLIHLAVLVIALADERSPISSIWLVRALPLSVYLFSGLAKLNAQWLSGRTLVSLVDQRTIASPSIVLAYARPLSVGMALFELALPMLLLAPRTRRAALWLAAAFHFYLQLTVHPDVFGMMMIVLLLAFVEPQKQSPSQLASAGYTTIA